MYKKDQIYLAGAIEAAPDGGVTWRQEVTPTLEAIQFKVFDPCIETDGLLAKKLGWEKFSIEKWRELKIENPEKFKRIGEWIVKQDLKAVINSDILLTYFDKYVTRGAGTYGEITVARFMGLANLLIIAPDFERKDIPLWVLGCVDKIFNSVNEAFYYLECEYYAEREW
jgi:hypothetical protein